MSEGTHARPKRPGRLAFWALMAVSVAVAGTWWAYVGAGYLLQLLRESLHRDPRAGAPARSDFWTQDPGGDR